jgi:hypothetical protein
MGLLDDAIREHLDLKRQHGADESELRRKESEALGPARREAPVPEPGEAAADEEALPVGEPVVTPEEPAVEADIPVAEEELAESEDMAIEDFEEEETAVAPPLPPDDDDDLLPPAPVEQAPVEREDPFDEPFAAETEPRRAAEPPPPAGDGEDVLEETPEFLQDTPEHDRLWFEQKPPRDFDFDEE